MKLIGNSARLVLVASALVGVLGLAGCNGVNNDAFGTGNRRSIEPAPTGLPNSGIGAPGGASADTRAVGSVAASEGEATASGPGVGVGSTSGTHR